MQTEQSPPAGTPRNLYLSQEATEAAVDMLTKHIGETEAVMAEAMAGSGIAEPQVRTIQILSLARRLRANLEALPLPDRKESFSLVALMIFPTLQPEINPGPAPAPASDKKGAA